MRSRATTCATGISGSYSHSWRIAAGRPGLANLHRSRWRYRIGSEERGRGGIRGIAKIGDSVANTEMAGKLIDSASEIFQKFKKLLPPELHWPEYKHSLNVEIRQRLS